MSSYEMPQRAPHGEWAYLSRSARDLAYNNVAAVRNSAQIIAARAAASAQFRTTRAGKLDPLIGGRFTLDQAHEALSQLSRRQTTGKILLIP